MLLDDIQTIIAILLSITTLAGSVVTAFFFIYRYFNTKSQEAMTNFTNNMQSIVKSQDSKIDSTKVELRKDLSLVTEKLDDIKASNEENTAAIKEATKLITETVITANQTSNAQASRISTLESQFKFFYDYVMGISKASTDKGELHSRKIREAAQNFNTTDNNGN